MTDDVKALAEQIAQYRLGSDDSVYSSKHVANILEHWKDRLASQREDGDAVMAETNRCAQIVRSCVGTDCDFETAAQLILNRNFK